MAENFEIEKAIEKISQDIKTEPAVDPGNKKKKILVVDDEQDMVNFISARLQKSGYQVVVAYDGKEAIDKVKEENPDLVILDIMLPELDGFQVCRTIKFDRKYQGLPIIMLTSKTEQKDQKTGQEVGADFYMTKPFEDQQLLEEIKKLLAQ